MTKIKILEENNPGYLYRLQFNTYIIEKLKLFYLDTPKTGGTSIKTLLANLLGEYQLPETSSSNETIREMFIHDRTQNHTPNIYDFSIEQQDAIMFSAQWKRICVVRNPYERIFSAWFSKVLLRQPGYIEKLTFYALPESYNSIDEINADFERFIEYLYLNESQHFNDPHWDRQYSLLFGNQIHWHRIIKYENLNMEFNHVLSEIIPNNSLQLEKTNISGYNPNFSRFSGITLNRLQELYQKDFENYAYDYKILPEGNECYDPQTLLLYINSVIGRNLRLNQLFQEKNILSNRITKLEQELDHLTTDNNVITTRLNETISTLNQTTTTLNQTTITLNNITRSRGWKTIQLLRKMRGFKG